MTPRELSKAPRGYPFMEPRHAINVSGSSCVEFACYYPQSQTLRLGFIGGESYDYLHVPPSVIADFAAAESKGRFVNEVIKRFRYEKLAQ